jgi:hypothetical protein
MIEFDLTFPCSYEVEELREFPGTGKFSVPVYSFPRPDAGREVTGLWLKINPASGRAWVGVFAWGFPRGYIFSRILSTPDPARLCVISKSAAYIVNTEDPDIWEKVWTTPVLDVRLVPEHNILVFSDFTCLAAYGNGGLVWKSSRVCWDDLKIRNVTGETIEGTGYDPTNSITHESRFVVDLKTGNSLLPPPQSVDGRPVW